MKLNIGCGTDIKKGWVNCDNGHDLPEGVMRVDASEPLPWPSNSFETILASHVIEHIVNYGDTILECHRVLKPGGILIVKTPFGINSDAFHVRYLWPESLKIFWQSNEGAGNLIFTDKRQKFQLQKLIVKRSFWLSWHLRHYLNIGFLEGRTWKFPVGKRVEIIWVLRKVQPKSRVAK